MHKTMITGTVSCRKDKAIAQPAVLKIASSAHLQASSSTTFPESDRKTYAETVLNRKRMHKLGSPTGDDKAIGGQVMEKQCLPTLINANSNEISESHEGQEGKKPKGTFPVPHQSTDEGHYYVVLGENLDQQNRYKIISYLGHGTFGKVVEAWDRQKREFCAIKIVRHTEKYTRDARIEAHYMERIARADPYDEYGFVQLRRYFVHSQGNMCLVMPRHGKSLLSVTHRFGPLPLAYAAQIAQQLGHALHFLHIKAGYVHTDLKPENILLDEPLPRGARLPATFKIRICDLGGCSDAKHAAKGTVVTTRHYRAPEVILGLGWSYAADIWSVGCILYEIVTGKLLYNTHDDLEHLYMMQVTHGPLPRDWAERCHSRARSCFMSDGSGDLCPLPCSERLSELSSIESKVRDPNLVRLIQDCLTLDPSCRVTAERLACHPAVQMALSSLPESEVLQAFSLFESSLHPRRLVPVSQPSG